MAATDQLIPSKWSGKDWDVMVTNTGMTAVQSGRTITVSSSEAARLEARRRWFRWSTDAGNDLVLADVHPSASLQQHVHGLLLKPSGSEGGTGGPTDLRR